MIRLHPTRLVAWIFVAVLGIVCSTAVNRALAQDKTPAAPAGEKASAKKLTGRLPAHYTEVVTAQQREAIYKIQTEYAPRIKDAQAKLAELTKERDDRITALLTPEQKQKLEKAKEQATSKRATKPAAAEKPAETKAK